MLSFSDISVVTEIQNKKKHTLGEKERNYQTKTKLAIRQDNKKNEINSVLKRK